MKVKIHGPNLRGAAQSKGTFHVHTADCGDNRHYGQGRFGGEVGLEEDHDSIQSIVEEVYADHIAEAEGDSPWDTWEGYEYEFWIAPCVQGLPYREEAS